jgi:uncharacterized protein
MIIVKVIKKEHKFETIVTGHSGYAKAGRDIVCASVSSIVQSTVIGLEKVLKLDAQVQSSDGYLRFIVDENSDTTLLVKTMVESIKDIANQYPKNVKMEEL